MWLARLTEMGMLRPSFVPPAPVRELRDYARARTHLVQDRTRCWQRLEKLLEGALIKVSAVASKLTTVSAQDMIRAMIGGERDPRALAGLARGKMKAKHDALVEALTGMFDDHHGELAQMLLDQIAFCDTRIAVLAARIEEHLDQITAAWGVDADGATGPGAGTGTDAAVLPAAQRLAEIPGVSAELARSVIAETGLDMSRFPTAAHLVSWAGLCPSARQSGPRVRAGKKGQGDSYLRGYLGQAATGAAGTATFLGERHGASPAAAAGPRPRSPSPAPSWSSSGTCSPTPGPGSPTSDRTTTPAAPIRTRRSATTSASSRPSAWTSPSPPPPDPYRPRPGPAASPARVRCRTPTETSYFRSATCIAARDAVPA